MINHDDKNNIRPHRADLNLSHAVNGALCWSLLCDETTDRMKREQMCITVRYVSVVCGEMQINEDPICLVDAVTLISESTEDVRLTGENIGKVILAKCRSLKLDLAKCVGQGMDEAANMCSEVKGAAAVVIHEAPMASYFHCVLHIFNLCALQAVKVTSIRNCVDLVREIIRFFSYSAVRNHTLQQEIEDVSRDSQQLEKLCDTRFVEKHSSILTCLQLLSALQLTVDRLSVAQTRSTCQEAARLLASMEKFEFLVNLRALAATSGLLVSVSRSLQAVGIDFV